MCWRGLCPCNTATPSKYGSSGVFLISDNVNAAGECHLSCHTLDDRFLLQQGRMLNHNCPVHARGCGTFSWSILLASSQQGSQYWGQSYPSTPHVSNPPYHHMCAHARNCRRMLGVVESLLLQIAVAFLGPVSRISRPFPLQYCFHTQSHISVARDHRLLCG